MNNKPLGERFNNIIGEGPDRWLSRTVRGLFETPMDSNRFNDGPRGENPPPRREPTPQEEVPTPRWGSAPDHPEEHPRYDALQEFVAEPPKNARGRELRMPGARQALGERMQDENFKAKAVKFFHEKDRHAQDNQDRFQRYGRVTDLESGKNFIQHVMGYALNDNGTFSIPQAGLNPQERMIYGMPYAGDGGGAGASRTHLPSKIVESFSTPEGQERLQRVKQATDAAGVQDLHSDAMHNNVDWALATELYDLFDSAARTNQAQGLDNWGASGTTNTLNAQDIEYLFDNDNKFLGTNIDQEFAALQTPEERDQFFLRHFTTGGTGRNRGIAMLQKTMNLGGRSAINLSPEGFSPINSTVDHGVAIQRLDDDRFAELPGNLIPENGSFNQFKRTQNEDYNQIGEKIEEVLEGRLKAGGSSVDHQEGQLGLERLPQGGQAATHLVDLVKDKHFNEPREDDNRAINFINNVREGHVGPEYLADMDWPELWQVMQHSERGPQRMDPVAQQVKQFLPGSLTRLTADHRDQPWGGGPGRTNGTELQHDDSLEGLRKVILAASLFGGNFNEQTRRGIEQLGGRRQDLSTAASRGRVASYLGNLFSADYQDPARARIISWLYGLTSNRGYVNSLFDEVGGKALQDLEGQVPNYSQFEDLLQQNKQDYLSSVENDTPNGQAENGFNMHPNIQDNEKLLSPYKREGSDLAINPEREKHAKYLYRSQYGQDALRDNGMSDAVDLYNQALAAPQILDREGNPIERSDILSYHSPFSGSDMHMEDLFGRLLFDPNQDKLVEEVQ